MKTLRERFSPVKTHITDIRMTGRKSALVDYEQLDADGEVTSEGTAACFDVDLIKVDDDDCLEGKSSLSASGEFIVETKEFDRTGLGPRKKAKK